MTMIVTSLLIIALMLVLSAFFSGMELAFLNKNRLKLEIDRKQSRVFDFIADFVELFFNTRRDFVDTQNLPAESGLNWTDKISFFSGKNDFRPISRRRRRGQFAQLCLFFRLVCKFFCDIHEILSVL